MSAAEAVIIGRDPVGNEISLADVVPLHRAMSPRARRRRDKRGRIHGAKSLRRSPEGRPEPAAVTHLYCSGFRRLNGRGPDDSGPISEPVSLLAETLEEIEARKLALLEVMGADPGTEGIEAQGCYVRDPEDLILH